MKDWSLHYTERLYPLQDRVLEKMKDLDLPFYFTGGTLIHRFNYNYRYSDDLDFFVNDHDNFNDLKKDIIKGFKEFSFKILNQSNDFLSIFIDDILKIDYVNDIPFYFGNYIKRGFYPRTDNIKNILSNKITCIQSRMQPKDLVDIWVIWRENERLDWREIFTASQSKAAGIYPPYIAKLISSFPYSSLSHIKFVSEDYQSLFIDELPKLIDSLL